MAPLMTTTPLTSSAFDYGIRAIGRRTFVDESPFISNEESLSLCVHMQLECIENVKYSQHCNLLLPKFCTELASKRGSPGQNYKKKCFAQLQNIAQQTENRKLSWRRHYQSHGILLGFFSPLTLHSFII